MKDSDFKRVPLVKLQETPNTGGTHKLRTNSWWLVDKNNNALIYKGMSPQCNIIKEVNEPYLINNDHPGVKNVFVEKAWGY